MAAPTARALPPTANAVKRRQWLVVVLLVLAVLAIGAGIRLLNQSSPAPAASTPKATMTPVATPATGVDAQKVWRAEQGGRLDKLADDLKSIRDRMESTEVEAKKNKDAKPVGGTPAPAPAPADAKLPLFPPGSPPRLAQTPALPAALAQPPQPPNRLNADGFPATATTVSRPPSRIVSVNLDDEPDTSSPARPLPTRTGTDSTSGRGAAAGSTSSDSSMSMEPGRQQMPTTGGAVPTPTPLNSGYLPTSSFVAATNLHGLLAPTKGAAQASPAPIAFRITDRAILPNFVRAPVKDCFAQGAAHGVLGEERVHVRLMRLSCVTNDDRAVDMQIYGYVVGEDGMEGMSGRLVTKQGQAMANSLLAGIASNIGRGLQQQSTTNSVSPLGSVSSVQDGKILQNGLAGGVGSSLDRLAKYYLDLADEMHPVMEVGALRQVTLVFAKGFDPQGPGTAAAMRGGQSSR